MNANHHRTIYNQARGCLMAVAETAKSSGKASGGSGACRKARSALSLGNIWLQANHNKGYGLPCLQTTVASNLKYSTLSIDANKITAAMSAALTAGMTGLASQAATGLINNGGDLSKTLEQLGSSESLKGLALSMVTAGALQGLSDYLPKDIANATAKSPFTDQLTKNLINNAAAATIRSALTGTSLEDNLKSSIVDAIITTGMAQTANAIGDAAGGKNETNKLNEFGRAVAHAVAGCIAGAAKAGGSGGDGCSAGAVGAVVGELAASFYNGDVGDGTGKPKADTTQFAALMSGVAGAIVGGDAKSVNLAASTGANAALNNYLNHTELTSKKEMQGLCSKGNDLACKAVVAYNDLDLKRNAALDACVGVVSPACDTVTTQASKDIQGLAGYAADMRNKFAQTGELKYKQEMDNAQGELKEAAAGLKNYYYVLSGGNSDATNPDPNYVKYKLLESMTNGQDLGAALTGAPTANPSNKALGRLTETSAPLPSAADKRKAEIELNARTEDGQQYVNNPAPTNVPNTTTRKDNDFSSPVNDQGKPKASTDAEGNLNAANPQGTGSIQSHVRGGQSQDTPYISTTDNTIATNPKNYGTNQATVDTRQLQRDLNNGTVDSTTTQIVTPAEVQANLQQKVDAAHVRFDANPTVNNGDRLTRTKDDLQNAKDDGECLIKGCIPAPYIQLPSPQVPAAPMPSINPILITPSLPTNEGSNKK